MNPTDFTADSPGRLIPIAEGGVAFVPDPLPSCVSLGPEAAGLLERAGHALGLLEGVTRSVPNPRLLARPFVRREAELSSRIEGTYATQEDLVLFEVSPPDSKSPDTREVANYVAALELGLKRLRELPVCLRLIRELHGRLMRGVRGENKRAGDFRKVQNWIGRRDHSIAEARFVPPPAGELPACLNSFEKILHVESSLPFLVRLAMIHYQFEAIHPFEDGNGRIGRLLLLLLLGEKRVLSQPLLQLSAYFERHRTEYYDHLLWVSQKGAWEAWIQFFLRGVEEAAREATEHSQLLLSLRQQYREKMQTAGASALALKLVDALFVTPATAIPLAARLLRVTYPSAQLVVQRLLKAGILVETTGRKRNRVYVAPGILAILSAPKAG